MDNIKKPIRRYGDYLNCKPDADAILLELEQIKRTVEALAEEGTDKNIAGITLRADYGTGMIWWEIDVIPEDDKDEEKRMLVKPLSKDVERYPISDARIMFDSEKQRDKFKALLEKADKMREILFRAKRVVDNEWVEGCFDNNYLVPIISTRWDNDEIYRETLGQFIGLYDRNGVRVFEGDILKIYLKSNAPRNYYHPVVPCTVVVKWDLDFCAWIWETITQNKDYIFFPGARRYYSCEVIGNIYDNPELLEVAD